MNLSSQTHGSVELVSLPPRLVMANAEEARTALRGLVADGRRHLVLDLHAVQFVDSSGLSVLVSALKAVQPQDGRVVLLSPSDGVRSLIELTRLHQVFEIFEDREAAIRELDGHEAAR